MSVYTVSRAASFVNIGLALHILVVIGYCSIGFHCSAVDYYNSSIEVIRFLPVNLWVDHHQE